MQSLLKNNSSVEVCAELEKARIKIPTQHVSKSGYPFQFNSDEWRLDGSTVIYFERLSPMPNKLKDSFKKALCRYAEELSAMHTFNMFNRFNAFMKANNDENITVDALSNYRASFNSDNEYKLGALKGFLLAWYEWRFDGIGKEVANYLDELILRGNPKGNAVKGACPYSGPLTHNELGALIDWASNAFNTKSLNLKEYAFFMTLALTGRRAVQIRSLRSKDIIYREDSKGHDYVINCPRAKQRGFGFREQFTPLTINEDLYLILNNKRNESIKLIENTIGATLHPKIQCEIPVFLEESRLVEINDKEDLVRILNDVPDYLHMARDTAFSLLRTVSIRNTAHSERTGEFINFTAYRFRYTKGTNLTRRGITGVALAAALDHTDTQNIGVYVENTEETAKQIDKVMAPILAPLAQAFAGKLIASERDAIRANDPNSRVKNRISQNIGNCGTHSFCASGYRACYTCINFQPWLEAPHTDVLTEILEERQQQEERGVSQNVIQSTDKLLMAVQQVVLMCEAIKSEEKIVNV